MLSDFILQILIYRIEWALFYIKLCYVLALLELNVYFSLLRISRCKMYLRLNCYFEFRLNVIFNLKIWWVFKTVLCELNTDIHTVMCVSVLFLSKLKNCIFVCEFNSNCYMVVFVSTICCLVLICVNVCIFVFNITQVIKA